MTATALSDPAIRRDIREDLNLEILLDMQKFQIQTAIDIRLSQLEVERGFDRAQQQPAGMQLIKVQKSGIYGKMEDLGTDLDKANSAEEETEREEDALDIQNLFLNVEAEDGKVDYKVEASDFLEIKQKNPRLEVRNWLREVSLTSINKKLRRNLIKWKKKEERNGTLNEQETSLSKTDGIG